MSIIKSFVKPFVGIGILVNLCYANDVVVLIDYSKSISKDDWRIYDSVFEKTVNGDLKIFDRLSVMPIGTNTQGRSEVFGSITMKDMGHPVKSRNYNNQNKQKLFDIYLDKQKKLSGKEDKTLIMSSIRAAVDYTKNSSDPKKTIIILSDMDDSSNEFPRSQVNSGKCSDIDSMIKKAGNKPNLSGVNVVVRGASAQNDNAYTCKQKFWESYFKTSGAASVDYVRQ